MRIHLLFPRDRVSQRSFVCQVAHNNHCVGVSAKQLRDATQPILSSKVPKLEADRVTVNGENLERELTGNSRPVGGVEPVVDELSKLSGALQATAEAAQEGVLRKLLQVRLSTLNSLIL